MDLAAVVLLFAGIAGLVVLVNSNVSWTQSDQAFADSFERALQTGTDWMVTHPETENAALLYMLADMAALSGDVRLRTIVTNAVANSALPPDSVLRRWLEPDATVRRPSREELSGLEDYERWCLYAIAPQHVDLIEAERNAMFDPDRFVWGSRTHQLLALILYKDRTANTPAVTDLMNHLSQKIAREEHWDIRVTDLYMQRMAFVLAAGRPDLIRRRWVERVIAKQHADGGWISSWYGWGPGLFVFRLSPKVPNSHTTVQGVWTLYMLKYRYPEWLRRHASTAFSSETGSGAVS
jgi:hypothetical protein